MTPQIAQLHAMLDALDRKYEVNRARALAVDAAITRALALIAELRNGGAA